MKKRIISLTLALSLLMVCLAVSSHAEERSGISFTAADRYATTSAPKATPRTWEAWIKVNSDAPATRLGTIVGNYSNDQTPSAGIEIRTDGNPALWWTGGSGTTPLRVAFTEVDVRTGEWLHLAIVSDKAAGKVHCYINGVLEQTLDGVVYDITLSNPLAAGGDLRPNNEQFFKNAKISSFALFSDVRSATEIAADMSSVDYNDAAILGAYDLSAEGALRLKDYSPNKNHLIYNNTSDPSKNERYTADDEDKSGMYFDATTTYEMVKAFDTTPNTFEAWINFPSGFGSSSRGGVILGNYTGNGMCINFEIFTNGNPRIYRVDEDNKIESWVFNEVNVYNGKWTHVAVVRDSEQGKLHCYIDGTLKQTINIGSTVDIVCDRPFAIGADLRSGNAQNFKGKIKSAAFFSDARTSTEIAADMESVTSADSLIAAYNFNDKSGAAEIEDESGNGYTLKANRQWFKEKSPVTDYAYSFVAIGDTQIVTEFHPDKLSKIYDWIVANKDEKNIQFVFGLGDITNSSTQAEWTLAKQQISKLDGVVPYSLVRGNHDKSAAFNSAFPYDDYKGVIGGSYDGKMENTWRTLTVGDIKYLILTLDYGASDAVLKWAGDIADEHPDHNVIVTTHAYLYRDGTTLDQGDVCPPATTGGSNNGDHIWDKFISKHKNIVLVLCGHDPCDDVVVAKTKGKNGNIVTQMLIDPQGVDAAQGATGMVAVLYFSEDGKNVTVEYYSTVREEYFKTSNQFSMEIEVVDPNAAPPTSSESPTSSGSPTSSSETKIPQTGNYGFELIIIAMLAFASLAAVVKMKYNLKKQDR